MASAAGSGSSGDLFFEPCTGFRGARDGLVFKLGPKGLGYYADSLPGAHGASQIGELRPKLPEGWRHCPSLRQVKLQVHKNLGAGLSLDTVDFGFAVSAVDPEPGQDLHCGDVIVAIEGRPLCGLSAPQMQASFLKRKADGARLQVASKSELEHLITLDPSVIEGWDAQHQRSYFFSKKTGKSAWIREELQADVKSSSPSKPVAPGQPAAGNFDIATFLTHGYSAPKAVQARKKRKEPEKPNDKNESDRARDERKRWDDWNAGEKGGYTEQFFEKYKNCQSNPQKPKEDKRLEGSVGPGQGMEYMAAWTGSKNSFN